jgi:hypothetical protein
MRMKRVVRGFIAAPLVLIGLLSAAPADAQRPHPPYIPVPDPTVPTVLPQGEYCDDFTAIVTFTKLNQYIVQDTTDPVTGVETLRITGNAQATVTNQSTGESVTYNISGPATVVINPDGSFSADAGGPNLLWTTQDNSFAGVPTISYTTGHVTFEVDASGQTTSYTLAGGARQTDVCAVLAS